MLTAYTPGPAFLTSLNRLSFFLGKDVGEGRINGIDKDTEEQRRNRRSIMSWAQSVSQSAETYTRREFMITERTQFFNTVPSQITFSVNAIPLVSISEVAQDVTGQFDGAETTLIQGVDYFFSCTGSTVTMWFPLLVAGNNSLRIKYSGGLAYHPVNSTFSLSSIAGTSNLIAGNYVYGSTSEARGKVVSFLTPSIVVENLYGCFVSGERLTVQATLNSQDLSGTSAVIDSIDKQSLVEAFPDIARAVEIEVGYMQRAELSFEKQSNGESYHYRDLLNNKEGYAFQPETKAILDRYKNFANAFA